MSKSPYDKPRTGPRRSSPCVGRSFDREHFPSTGGRAKPLAFGERQPARPTQEDIEAQKRFYEEYNTALLAKALAQSG
nr:hypothetical protein [Pandoravirus massiliensis]